MIFDLVKRAPAYRGLGPQFATAFEFLKRPDLATLEPGKYELKGHDLFATISHFSTKPKGTGKYEAHRKYIDVQYVIEGAEEIGYAPLESLKVVQEYDAEKDFLKAEGRGDMLLFPAGTFAIFWPFDAHMPGMSVTVPTAIKKLVVKVPV